MPCIPLFLLMVIYCDLILEQVYATILYYLGDRQAVSAYLADWLEHSHKMQEEERRNPSPVVLKFMKLKAEREAEKKENDAQTFAR